MVIVVMAVEAVVVRLLKIVLPPINLVMGLLPRVVVAAPPVVVRLLDWVFGTLVDLVMKRGHVPHHRLVGVVCWMIVM